MKKLEENFNSFLLYSQENQEMFTKLITIIEGNMDSYDIYVNTINEIFEKLNLDGIVDNLKKIIYISCLRQSLDNMRLKWAYPTIDNILKLTFYSKNKLSEEQFKEIEKINNIFKNKLVSTNNFENRSIIRDEKIKNNPLEAYHQVTDARAERTVISGMDTWTSKQNGLTYGKLFLN